MMSFNKKNSVQCIPTDEPAFIKRFKEKVGYKEGDTVNSKRAPLERDDTGSDEEDEKPTVVVLKKGDLTEAELEALKKEGKVLDIQEESEPEEEPPADGRIMFKKPTKRASNSESDVLSKKKKEEKKKGKSESKKIKNKSLLSFNDEEEEDN